MSWNQDGYGANFESAREDVEMTDAPSADEAGSGVTGDTCLFEVPFSERTRTTPGPWWVHQFANTASFNLTDWTIDGNWHITNFDNYHSFNVTTLRIEGNWTIDKWMISHSVNLTDVVVGGNVTVPLMVISAGGTANQRWHVNGRFHIKKCVVEGKVNIEEVATTYGFDVDEISIGAHGKFEVSVKGPHSKPVSTGSRDPVYKME